MDVEQSFLCSGFFICELMCVVVVVDDLIATGGTLSAAKNLIEQGGAKVTDILGVIGLPFLNYEKNLAPLNITTLINFDSE